MERIIIIRAMTLVLYFIQWHKAVFGNNKIFEMDMSILREPLLKVLLTCIFLFGFESGVSAAPTFTDLHNFNCALEGCNPEYDGLAQGRDGNLYGTAYSGGSYGLGSVFKVTPTGTVTTIYNFDGTTGSDPFAGLTLGTDGNLYGTTFDGGSFGYGTIFKITPAGTLTVLHNFGSVAEDGAYPYTHPTQDTDGSFYGVTSYGAVANYGVAYKISSSGVYKIINGATLATSANLIRASDGNFYGTSIITCNCVFKMTTTGKVSIIYSFDGAHGSRSFGPVVQGTDGNLYGMTYAGGTSDQGVVFKLTMKGAITVLLYADANFGNPYTGLLAATDGHFYGATSSGGTSGYGVLFKITKTGTSTVESNIDATLGAELRATPMQHTNGKIYGLTFGGGVNGQGVFYSLDESLAPFARLTSAAAKVGVSVGILGQGFIGTTAVSFGGTAATFTVVSDTYMTAKVPKGALTGNVTVTTPTGALTSNRAFRATPTTLSFAPTSCPVVTPVTITGSGLTQTSIVTFGGKTTTRSNEQSGHIFR